MSERVRAAVAGLLALLSSGCFVSGTLGTYTTRAMTGESEATQATGTSEPTSASEPTETSGEVCPDGEAGPCASCLADFCCDALSACEGGLACACMFDCLTAGATATECVTKCGAGAVAMQFSVCTMKNCAPVCSQE